MFIVIYIKIKPVSYTHLDVYKRQDYGRQDLDTVGSGEGYYITNGYMMPITWEKDSRSGKTYYSYSNGDEIKVSDGNTFIQVMPSSRDVVVN